MTWELLRRAIAAAVRQSRVEAAAALRAILTGDAPTAVRAIARAFLNGWEAAWPAHATQVNLPPDFELGLGEAAALRARAIEQGQVSIRGILNLDDLTEAQAAVLTRAAAFQATMTGQDDAGNTAAGLASPDFKAWVRAWGRADPRDHHTMLEGVVIPTSDRFRLPGGRHVGTLVIGPRDWTAVRDPGEWWNCGHALRYLTEADGQDLARTLQLGRSVYRPPRASP